MKAAVIGGGVIGLTSAYHLLQDGHDVTVIDAQAPGAGASHGNAGWVVPAESGPVPGPGLLLKAARWMLKSDSPLYVRPSVQPEFVRFMFAMARHCNSRDYRAGLRANLELGERTMALLDAYEQDGIDFEMHREGLVVAFTDPHGLEHHEANFDVLAAAGLDPKVLTPTEVATLEPALSAEKIAGGISFPHERHLRPDLLVDGLVKRCTDLGCRFLTHTPVSGFRRSGERVTGVETSAGTVEADTYLVAAGTASAELGDMLGVPLPIWPGRGYSLDVTPSVRVRRMISLADVKVVITPMDDRLRLSGTMEFTTKAAPVSSARVAAIERAPSGYLVEWRDVEPMSPPWAGNRPMTPDGLPILGAVPGTDNAYVATGHGMLGVTLGPVSGELMARYLTERSMPEALRPFRPERFQRRGFRRRSRVAQGGAAAA